MSAPAAAASSASAVSSGHPSAEAEAALDAPVDEGQLLAAVVSGQVHHGSTAQAEVSSNLHMTCKWKTHSYQLLLPVDATVGLLKTQIALLTNVRQHHQKLVLAGAKIPGGAGGKLHDELLLSSLSLKHPAKVMMIGNPEEELIQDDGSKAAALEPVDDLDYDYRTSELLELQADPDIRAKIDKYWLRTKDTFTVINPIRPGKKLLVLDLDYTLFDMKSQNDDWSVLKRPGTDLFLTAMYQHYELVIWSQTSWRWLELKLTELGILTHPHYKVCFVMDKTSMFSIHSPDGKGGQRKHHVKCLELIWRKFPAWSAANTVHVDDLGRNFALNPGSGLKILPYKNSEQTQHTDRELAPLAQYLAHIAFLDDFRTLDHSKWKSVTIAPPPAAGDATAANSSASAAGKP